MEFLHTMKDQINLFSDPKFIALEKALMRFNGFEILGVELSENRNSNVLAWLLDENGNHGLGRVFLTEFLPTLLCDHPKENEKFTVYREKDHLDITLVSNRRCVVIENKILAADHKNQLRNYRKHIASQYPDKMTEFVYLTPNGSQPKSKGERPYWKLGSHLSLIKKLEDMQSIWAGSAASDFLRDFTDSIATALLKTGEKHVLARQLVEEWPSLFHYSASIAASVRTKRASQRKALEFITKHHVSPPKGSGFFSKSYPYRDAFASAFKSRQIEILQAGQQQSTYFSVAIGKTSENAEIPAALTFRYNDKRRCLKVRGYILPKEEHALWNHYRQIILNKLPSLISDLQQSDKLGRGKSHVSFFSLEIEFDPADFSCGKLNQLVNDWLSKHRVIETHYKIHQLINQIIERNDL